MTRASLSSICSKYWSSTLMKLSALRSFTSNKEISFLLNSCFTRRASSSCSLKISVPIVGLTGPIFFHFEPSSGGLDHRAWIPPWTWSVLGSNSTPASLSKRVSVSLRAGSRSSQST